MPIKKVATRDRGAVSATGVPTWTLGDRLDKALRTSGVEVLGMARILAEPPAVVEGWLDDDGHPSHPQMVMWASACGVPLAWLAAGADADNGPRGGLPVEWVA